MHQWLLSLTRSDDDRLLWAWVAIVAAHAVLGVFLGRLRRPGGRSSEAPADPLAPPAPFG